MNYEQACVEINFHNRLGKIYRKSWNKNIRITNHSKYIGCLIALLNGDIYNMSLSEEDKQANDWCIEN